jgi:hypothetical protein
VGGGLLRVHVHAGRLCNELPVMLPEIWVSRRHAVCDAGAGGCSGAMHGERRCAAGWRASKSDAFADHALSSVARHVRQVAEVPEVYRATMAHTHTHTLATTDNVLCAPRLSPQHLCTSASQTNARLCASRLSPQHLCTSTSLQPRARKKCMCAHACARIYIGYSGRSPIA